MKIEFGLKYVNGVMFPNSVHKLPDIVHGIKINIKHHITIMGLLSFVYRLSVKLIFIKPLNRFKPDFGQLLLILSLGLTGILVPFPSSI